ncbi:hypothetical protein ETU08_06320 [Apibacter muscae]|uniref:cyclophilin-like fold protein n=1 Tax=Apibacter muscae TaxID=2509004 RepID=UPI0011ABAB39|nr:cyclophilin-like fold protein [Apibacter muscae]TWP30169.1 hypothetical protein ETU08_06320 [Apibacter muscae]
MKILFLIVCLLLTTALSACRKDNHLNASIQMDNRNQQEIKLIIGTTTFNLTLENNHTSNAFVSQLPLTIEMNDLNENEKYGNLSENLPTNPSRVNTIHKGDVMLFGSNTLVIFYKSFNTSYDYTLIGKITHPYDLEKVFGKGKVRVKFIQ